MSFVEESDVQAVTESLLRRLTSEIAGVELPGQLPSISYAEAMARYGTDKPDLRFGLPVHDVTDVLSGSGFVVFKGAIEAGGCVRCIAIPPEHTLSRKQLDSLPAVVVDRGARGVAWAKVRDEGWAGPVAKHLTDEERSALCAATGCVDGGAVLFLAGPRSVVEPASGDLRLHLGKTFGLRDPTRFEALWVTEFPMYEVDDESGALVAKHHPFTAPVAEDVHLLESDPAAARARAYDLVLNGEEIAGGSIRIHDRDVQTTIFRNLGISEEEAEERFGFFVEALRYGVPPHGGIALGLDRTVATLAGLQQIRDVIAFPKTTSAADLMTRAPSRVDQEQLEELHVELADSAVEAPENAD
jgi:aspartyl-tRNA synthetase